MKIYTRAGDQGQTSLFGGERVLKSAGRVEAYGDVDELNSAIGLARAELGDAEQVAQLGEIQSSLFDLGAELATPGPRAREARGRALPRVSEADVAQLEAWIDAFDADLAPLTAFVLPGGSRPAALLHLARTVCRRAERRVVALAQTESVRATCLIYLNRLSDYLFTAARVANRRAGVEESRWIGRQR
jgi:cob(I)alamin adenosyltransferase